MEENMEKHCVLDEDRLCVDCGDCLVCDINPEKRCDNCMQCVKKSGADYLSIEIDEVIAGVSEDDAEQYEKTVFEKTILTQPVAKPSVRGIRPKKARKNASEDLGKSN